MTQIMDATGDGKGQLLDTPENVAVDGRGRIDVGGARGNTQAMVGLGGRVVYFTLQANAFFFRVQLAASKA